MAGTTLPPSSAPGGAPSAPPPGRTPPTPPDPIDYEDTLNTGFDDFYLDDAEWFNNIWDNLNAFNGFENIGNVSSTGRTMMGNVFDQSMNGSIQSFDTAANRLRERLDKQAGVEQQQFVNQNLGNGFQGSLQSGLGNITQGKFGALSEGLVGLEDAFEGRRLEGLGIANNAAKGIGDFDLNKYQTQSNFTTNRNQQRSDAYNSNQQNRLTAASDKIDSINESRRQKLGLIGDVLGILG